MDGANDIDDVGSYFEKADVIEALKDENERLRQRIHREIKAKSKWKSRYEKVKPERKTRRTKKNQRALELIAARENGDETYKLIDIAHMLDIGYGTLKHMAYEYRQMTKD